MKRIIVTLLPIIIIAVFMRWIGGYAERQANRLEQEGTGRDPDRAPIPPPVIGQKYPKQLREMDDVAMPSAMPEKQPDGSSVQVSVDPVHREKLAQAVFYRSVSNVTKGWWWVVPAGLAGLLVVRRLRPQGESQASIEPAKEVPSELPPA
jgi:hypothetical protein